MYLEGYHELQKQVLAASKKKRLDEQQKYEYVWSEKGMIYDVIASCIIVICRNVTLVLANRSEVQQLSNELILRGTHALVSPRDHSTK